MKSSAKKIYKYSGNNPFSDNQGKNFLDKKIADEFYPTPKFWSLFNDQHEILVGTRGCGKTFLLRMMRLSMLKRIEDERAQKIVDEKSTIAFYVPMHLEFLSSINNLADDRRIELYYFLFNALLAESIVAEVNEYIKAFETEEYIQQNYSITKKLSMVWLDNDNDRPLSLSELSTKIQYMFSSFDREHGDINDIPEIFRQDLCSPLIVAQEIIKSSYGLQDTPNWVVCVDEAEFIIEPFQICINKFIRSNTNGIALKIATLPFHYTTLETGDANNKISVDNDYNFKILDMDYESQEYKSLCDSICRQRLSKIDELNQIGTLESFLGIVGNETMFDYYKNERKCIDSDREDVKKGIISQLSPYRVETLKNKKNIDKSVFDKLAPIYYIRKIYAFSKKGSYKPGWYAGAEMVRKISQGNPRMFLQIMNSLFEAARNSSSFSEKTQHEIIYDYSKKFCDATVSIAEIGPLAKDNLGYVSETIKNKTHDQYLTSTGCNFKIKYADENDFQVSKKWIELSIAYSRLIASSETLQFGIDMDTEYKLCNAMNAVYWIPMRKCNPAIVIKFENIKRKTNTKNHINHQISIDLEDLL